MRIHTGDHVGETMSRTRYGWNFQVTSVCCCGESILIEGICATYPARTARACWGPNNRSIVVPLIIFSCRGFRPRKVRCPTTAHQSPSHVHQYVIPNVQVVTVFIPNPSTTIQTLLLCTMMSSHVFDNKLFSPIPCSESQFHDDNIYQYQYSIENWRTIRSQFN
jgi:hypothetical protein